MRVYPESAYDKLGYTTVLKAAARYCLTDEGRDFLVELKPLTHEGKIVSRLRQTAEFRDLLLYDQALPISYLPSMRMALRKAEIPGNYLTEEEFHKLHQWLGTVRKLVDYLEQRKEKYPELAGLLRLNSFDTRFSTEIEKMLSPEGHLVSHASPELVKLRKAIAEKQAELRTRMERLMRAVRQNGWTDQHDLTLRNERLVIPVSADFKGRVDGLIHDVSGSGQTLFIEPLEAVPLNNAVRELRLRERNEIIRILTELTDKLRPCLPDFVVYLKFLMYIDVIRAKAKLAIDLNCGDLPELDARCKRMRLVEARNPQLYLQKGREAVVPLNLTLSSEHRIVLVSGPNAGGKSVALKTAGLCQLLVQAGFLVPASVDSCFPIFRRLYLDLGDDQSIQNDLSTYTSHLRHMNEFLGGLNSFSFCLIDEFGSGTDPMLGGPMAEALLEKFVASRCLGLITTHYSNLKDFGAAHPNVQNAAMLFDLGQLKPTFQLRQGVPGSSYAFEIAERAGIPPEVIAQAKSKVGEARTGIETLLKDLKRKEEELDRTRRELDKKQREAEAIVEKNRKAQQELEIKRKKLAKELKEATAYLIHEGNKKIEHAVRQIREAEAEKERVKQVREELKKELRSAEVTVPDEPDPEVLPFEERPEEVIEVGDWVKLHDSDTVVQVVQLKGNSVTIALGDIQTQAKLRDVVKVRPRDTRTTAQPNRFGLAWTQLGTLPRELDVRGKRVEEVLPILDRFMDDVLLAGMPEVFILHGKGSGQLREAVRRHLNKHYTQIKNLADAPENLGGSGITVVTLD
jgi:DNA mismatch repair protein MutS2